MSVCDRVTNQTLRTILAKFCTQNLGCLWVHKKVPFFTMDLDCGRDGLQPRINWASPLGGWWGGVTKSHFQEAFQSVSRSLCGQ